MAGEHLCLIYDTQAEVDSYLTSYFQIGKQLNQKCIYATDSTTLLLDNLTTVSLSDSYFKGLRFDPDKMIDYIKIQISQALSEGFSGVYGAGDMSWLISGELGSDRGVEYEAKLSQNFPNLDCHIICLYDRNLFPDEILINIFRTHQKFIYKNKLVDSPIFISPDPNVPNPVEHQTVEEILGQV